MGHCADLLVCRGEGRRLRDEVAERSQEHVVDALGAVQRRDNRRRSAGVARPSFARGIAVLEALAETAVVSLVDVVPPAGCELLQVARVVAATGTCDAG